MKYMNDQGERRFLAPILVEIGHMPLAKVDGDLIESTAAMLYPDASPATRNRQVYTPIMAVLAKSKIAIVVDRPKGANGSPRQDWLTKEEAASLIAAAWAKHPRFAALITFLLYTGCRLSEGLRLQVADIHFDEAYANIGITKNGKPRGAYLPPAVLQAIRLALAEPGNATWLRPESPRTQGSVFCLTKSGALYHLLAETESAAGVTIPEGVSFHIFRHSYGAWCRRYGKLDRAGMVATGAWASSQGAASYDHIEISSAARAVDMFPGAAGEATPVLKLIGEV
ncbi:site-specific integrase [Beijerinckia sp. L45]|uniref:tyrosine-type recombinase/integrase n=1 Tax=Beijerinckia sp. L45 TaxID=1641855 RepID=UPI00131D4A0C|nr:site-specific integrase [Beijerinckia sp. L45]